MSFYCRPVSHIMYFFIFCICFLWCFCWWVLLWHVNYIVIVVSIWCDVLCYVVRCYVLLCHSSITYLLTHLLVLLLFILLHHFIFFLLPPSQLELCPRTTLDVDTVLYLHTPEERLNYAVTIESSGLFRSALSGTCCVVVCSR